MQRVEAYRTEDGQVFASIGEAARHEFETYARSMYDESAVALMLQDPQGLIDRLHLVAQYGTPPEPKAVPRHDDGPRYPVGYPLIGEMSVRPDDGPRLGQFTIHANVLDNVRNAILATVQVTESTPIPVQNGGGFHYVAGSVHFAVNRSSAGTPPPVYQWSIPHPYPEGGAIPVTWSRKQ